MQEWPTKPIDEITETLIDYRGKTPPKSDEGIRLITAKVVKNGFILNRNHEYITEKTYQKWMTRGFPKRGDVLITTEAPLGEVAQLKTTDKIALAQRIILLRGNPKAVDQQYFLYALQSRTVQARLEARATGTTVKGIKQSELRQVEIPLPSLPIQHRIGEILSAYDDLIATNERRIALLEQMAQAVYREWFVHFRYPGHEDAEMQETEALGPVPAGWEAVAVPEAIEINPRIPIPDGEKHYVPMANVSETSMVVTHAEMRDTRRGRKFQNDDTLFARITPSLENGKTGYVQFMPSDDDVGVGSTEFIVLRSKTLCPEYVYLLARTEPFRRNAIKSMTGASGRQRVQLECFDNFHLAQPDEKTLERFEDTVRPMFESIYNLVERNQNLRRARDLLLPRLVSGEVAVETAKLV